MQDAGQEKEFSFEESLNESYFSDVIIKSSNGLEVSRNLHLDIIIKYISLLVSRTFLHSKTKWI